MKSLKFYTDSHIPEAVARQLRTRGIDVIRCQEVGMADAQDSEHLEYAVRNERAVITKDDDFLHLHVEWIEAGRDHYGIFYSPDRSRSAIGQIVSTCTEYYALIGSGAGTVEEDIMNQIVYIR